MNPNFSRSGQKPYQVALTGSPAGDKCHRRIGGIMAEERARDRGFYFFGLRNGVCVWACGCSNLPWARSFNFQITTIIIWSERY